MTDHIAVWKRLLAGSEKPWALFSHGTCVLITDPAEDLAAQAAELLKEWGPVRAGTSAGDFNVFPLEAIPGWVVTCHHADIVTYVGPDDVEEGTAEVFIGLLGRAKRDQDAAELEIVHLEEQS